MKWQSLGDAVADRQGRRQFLQAAFMGAAGVGASRWVPTLANELASHPGRKRQCLILWMAGGPSQIDSFDMKPDHANGGEFRPISTTVPGLAICEHLPRLAKHADQLAIVRSVSTKEGDHMRGMQLMRTGTAANGPIKMPSIGCSLAKELGSLESGLPNYISVGAPAFPGAAGLGPGYLGPRYAPTSVIGAEPGPAVDGEPNRFASLGVNHLATFPGVTTDRVERRRDILESLQRSFLEQHPSENALAQDTVYRRALRMMDGEVAKAFDLSAEPDEVRVAYGKGLFGQGCLLARRLLEQGVPVVEVTLNSTPDSPAGWDTHQDNFRQTRALLSQLDAGWGTLMTELSDRGLLESTTILWIGEFGRTPVINNNAGRDHFPQAWSCVFAGGGIQGGAAFGATSRDGMEVVEQPVNEIQLLATLCRAVGVDPQSENQTNDGRPVKIVDGAPIEQLLA
jgi:hypothetical protein